MCAGVGVAFFIYTALHPGDIVGWCGVIGALALALNFYIIRVSVDHQSLLITYGIGFIAREFDLHEINRIEMVGNYTLHALYNPHAERVPRLYLRNGGSITLPLNDTRRLLEVLRLPHA